MTRMHSVIVLLCMLPTIRSRATVHDDAIVHTKLGIIRGMQQKFEDFIVNAYLGVPFARPPIGSRRFALAEMIDPWQGELEARKLARTCYITPDNQFPQFPGAEMWNPPNVFDEDCLALNIWVPSEHDGRVMVWIYGGGFFSGSPSLDLYDGRVLACRQKVIVVNINYRLGPFGFLYFGPKSSIPGNMGLMDQQLALRWIHENIGAFGGDPRKQFALAEMIDPWQGELEARKLARTCYITPDNQFPQFPGAEMWNPPNVFDEDCLALNIWVPSEHDGRVMVWIYGGGFFSGSPSLDLYDGRVLACRQKVIVVNINYRLGPFGFLYFGPKSSIPGNMGLMDQQLALRWIHENIGAFGGDPRKVTLFGESAGAASVTAHLFAPGSFPYYQKAIVMSGTIINSWATKEKDMMFETSMFLARKLNCTSDHDQHPDVNLIAHCVRQAPASKVQVFDEDCLALNIWVPSEHDGRVMVWIYGGGFFSGSPSLDLYDGRVLACRQKVIVVNINYRLGPFGFLYFGPKSSIPGNMGLMDQQLALRWIHENIGAFGGDPRKVTLFGESAGAASVTAHLFAPGSFPYYQKAIVMSGTIINSWATKEKDMMFETSMFLARKLNCTSDHDQHPDVNLIAHCVRQAPASKVQRAADAVGVDQILPMTFPFVPVEEDDYFFQRAADAVGVDQILPMTFPFVPVEEDDYFFQGNVFTKLRKRDFKKDVSILIGSMKDEGTYWLPYYLLSPKMGFQFNHTISADDPMNRALINRGQYTRSLESFIPYFGDSQLVKHALLHAYEQVSESSDPHERLRDGVARFVGDFFFTCSLVEFSDVLADNIYGSVYMYYFTKRSSANPWPKWMGVMHGYEIEYVFGQPLRQTHLYAAAQLASEQRFSEVIMKYWTDFAVTGVPMPIWPKYNKVTRKSFVLDDEITGTSHRIDIDVHGKYCRLLSEAQSVIGQGSDCKTKIVAFTSNAVNARSSLLLSFLLISLQNLLYS
ncbi:Acetylcholinesterase 1 [Toxocara canis]|uniref:Acetylcholinesterase 1 n=1 Tax=Toxocara canis TaxID=6265 RepID=A0A0B2UNN1_TOXCA|nr:Acetylcholinesterase 1 [Toxocara canis]